MGLHREVRRQPAVPGEPGERRGAVTTTGSGTGVDSTVDHGLGLGPYVSELHGAVAGRATRTGLGGARRHARLRRRLRLHAPGRAPGPPRQGGRRGAHRHLEPGVPRAPRGAGQFGGDCLKFGGDALLIAYRAATTPGAAAAAACAMLAALRSLRRGSAARRPGQARHLDRRALRGIHAFLVGYIHRELCWAAGRRGTLDAGVGREPPGRSS